MALPLSDDPVYVHGNHEIEQAEGRLAWQVANSAYLARAIEYYDAMRRKYARAALLPWLSITPDPPEPTWDGELSFTPRQRERPTPQSRSINLDDEELEGILSELGVTLSDSASNLPASDDVETEAASPPNDGPRP